VGRVGAWGAQGRLVKWRERVAGMCKLVMKSLLGGGGRLRNVHKSHAWMEQLHTMVEGYLFSLISNKLMWGIQVRGAPQTTRPGSVDAPLPSRRGSIRLVARASHSAGRSSACDGSHGKPCEAASRSTPRATAPLRR
jgi:hypothetical protein